MNPHVSAITLGVKDVNRAKQFYSNLGWPIVHDFGEWVSFKVNDGSCLLGLYPWNATAGDAGVSSEGSGFRGITFSYLVSDEDRVAGVLDEAQRAGGTIVKPAVAAQWGGTTGFFTDPDGYLWKVASSTPDQPLAE